jgi:hypothetical protein
MINSIVTLANNEEYMILNATNYDSRTYYLMMGLDNNKNIISNKVGIFETREENNKLYLRQVKDSKLMIKLTDVFKNEIK